MSRSGAKQSYFCFNFKLEVFINAVCAFCKNKNNTDIESVSKLKILLIIIDYWK